MKNNNIIICGGHLAPALAVMEELKLHNYSLHFFGRKAPLEGDKAVSLEYQTIKKLGIPFYPIVAGRLQRSFTRYTIFSLLKIPVGFIQSIYYILRIKPVLIMSFGGYLSLPVCYAAVLLRIPIILHEQTHILGLTNRILSKKANTVCVSYKDTYNIPDGVKTVVTGLPVRKEIYQPHSNPDGYLFGNLKLPLIYITGGSIGARAINKVVVKTITQLAAKYRILHQCGAAAQMFDYKLLTKLRDKLPAAYRENYCVTPHVKTDDIGVILKLADLVISRSGANTVAEIEVASVPAIFIPLPWAADDEQYKNASEPAMAGCAKIIRQVDLTDSLLLETVDRMAGNKEFINKAKEYSKAVFYKKAAGKIAKQIKLTIDGKKR